MKHHFYLTMILTVVIFVMTRTVPLVFASSSKEAKAKVEEAEKALGEARDAKAREKAADDDWFKKQSQAFQDWRDANKKAEEARAAREKADQTGKQEDIKAAEKAEKNAKNAQDKADKSEEVSGAAAQALEEAKAAKAQAKEKAAGTIAPAEEAVDDLPESSVKKKLKERIQKAKEGLNQLALASPASRTVETAGGNPQENLFAKADATQLQGVPNFQDNRLGPAGVSAREMQFKGHSEQSAEGHGHAEDTPAYKA